MRQRAIVVPLILFVAVVGAAVWWLLQEESTTTSRSGAEPELAAASGGGGEFEPAELTSPGTESGSSRQDASSKALGTVPDEREQGDGVVARPRDRELVGRVVDRLGNPVPDATVRVSRDFAVLDWAVAELNVNTSREATTGADGRFAIVPPEVEQVRLDVTAPGYAPASRTGIELVAAGEQQLDPVVVKQGAWLSGRVFDGSGRGVEGAELSLVGDRSRGAFGSTRSVLATTESDGSFAIESLACGPWSIRVRHSDHPSATFEGRADEPGERVRGLEFKLDPGGAIRGQVAGIPDDVALEELYVSGRVATSLGIFDGGRDRREAALEKNGEFVLNGCRLGDEYTVRLMRRPGGRTLAFGRSLSEDVTSRAGDSGVTLHYQPESSVAFQVVDAETGIPLTTFDVRSGLRFPLPHLDDEGNPLREHADGRVRIGNLRPRSDSDELTLEITAVGYQDYTREGIALEVATERDLGVIALETVPVVVVQVTDPDGNPVEDAVVTLKPVEPEGDLLVDGARRISRNVNVNIGGGGDGAVVFAGEGTRRGTTDEDGIVELSSFEGERCTLRVEADHFAPKSQELLAPRGEKVERIVQLSKGGSIVVTVLDPDGQPVKNAEVQHRVPGAARTVFQFGGGTKRARSDEKGQLTFTNLEAGIHAFQLADAGAGRGILQSNEGATIVLDDSAAGDDWTEVELLESGEAQVTLTTEAEGTLDGNVFEAGLALAGAQLTLNEVDDNGGGPPGLGNLFGGGGAKVRTDGEGYYRFEGVTEGEYELVVEHSTRRMPSTYEVLVRRGEQSLDVELDISIIEGRLVDDEGAPIAGASVWAEKVTSTPAPRAMMVMVTDDGEGESVSMDDGSIRDRVTTDGEGRYTLRGVASGVDLVVKAEGDGIQPAESDHTRVAVDQTKTGVDLVGSPAGSVRVAALNADGSPARMILVTATYLGSEVGVQPKTQLIGPSGKATLKGMRPGPWEVSGRSVMGGPGAGGGLPDGVSEQVEVIEREKVDVSLVL